MVVARRAETYIRRRVHLVSSISRRVNGRGREKDGARLEAGLVDVVDGGARASGLGFMRPSYFASCEPVIPGRAGDLWPRCVPPAPLILPFRPESNFHLSSTIPFFLSRPTPAARFSLLPSPVVHIASCTHTRAREIDSSRRLPTIVRDCPRAAPSSPSFSLSPCRFADFASRDREMGIGDKRRTLPPKWQRFPTPAFSLEHSRVFAESSGNINVKHYARGLPSAFCNRDPSFDPCSQYAHERAEAYRSFIYHA